MYRFNLGVLLILCLLLLGCVVPSLKPLSGPANAVSEPALTGSWLNEDQSETYTFYIPEPGEPNVYRVVHSVEESETTNFEARLYRLGDALFLDLYPLDAEGPYGGYVFWHFIPVHSFYLVRQIEPTLKVTTLDPGWLHEYLADNPDAIEYAMFDLEGDELPVLTADTPDLEAFFAEHSATEGAFYDEMEYFNPNAG